MIGIDSIKKINFFSIAPFLINKAEYTAGPSRRVGQGQLCKNRGNSKMLRTERWTDGTTDRLTDTARCRVVCPRLKREEIVGSNLTFPAELVRRRVISNKRETVLGIPSGKLHNLIYCMCMAGG